MRSCAGVLWIVLAAAGVAADEPKADAKAEAKQLQGTWLMTGEDGAKARPEGDRVVIAGDKLTFYAAGEVHREFTFTLDPSASPKRIDLTRKKDDGKAETALAIYELKGDVLRICARDKNPAPRPTEFKDDRAADLILMTLKRKKP